MKLSSAIVSGEVPSGLVIDGPIRDSDTLPTLSIPVFALKGLPIGAVIKMVPEKSTLRSLVVVSLFDQEI